MNILKSASLGLAIVALLGAAGFAAPAAAHMMNHHDKMMMKSCMAMSHDDMMKKAGCMRMMHKMHLTDADMDAMKTCMGMSHDAMMADQNCMAMMKSHPDMAKMSMGHM